MVGSDHHSVTAGEQLAGTPMSGVGIRMRDQHDGMFLH